MATKRLSVARDLSCVLGATAAGASLIVSACSGGGSNGANPDASAGEAGATASTPASCANPTVPIVFQPMYSAFIAGGNETFAIPAVTADGAMATWTVSDPTQASLRPESFDIGGGMSVPGVLITVTGTGGASGQITVVATESGGACGASVLNITTNTQDDWNVGNARYNDGVALHIGPPPGFDGGGPRFRPDGGFEGGPPPFRGDGGSYFETDGGTACTNCHGPTAISGPFKDVSHTPEQTGGFSDSDLKQIIMAGEVPDGGYFDPAVIMPSCDGGEPCTTLAYNLWHGFHQWSDITTDQLPGIICYLRSLVPESQNGSSNFGGGRRRDGGMGPPGRMPDAGPATTDAATTTADSATTTPPADSGTAPTDASDASDSTASDSATSDSGTD